MCVFSDVLALIRFPLAGSLTFTHTLLRFFNFHVLSLSVCVFACGYADGAKVKGESSVDGQNASIDQLFPSAVATNLSKPVVTANLFDELDQDTTAISLFTSNSTSSTTVAEQAEKPLGADLFDEPLTTSFAKGKTTNADKRVPTTFLPVC